MADIAQRVDSCGVSPLQHAILFHYLACGPHTGCDIQQLELSLRATVEVARLVRAWQLVTARHPALRSCFRWDGLDAPQQDVMAAVDARVAHHDLSAGSVAERTEAIDRFLATDRLRGFDLDVAPLWRVTLFDLGEAGHHMVWTYSHAILDGCYTEVIAELCEVYDALGRGVAPRFRDRPAFRDHLAWVRQDWAAHAGAARGFWRHRLQGVVRPTTLEGLQGTTGTSRPATGLATLELCLGRSATDRVRRMSREHGVEVSTVVRAAWAMVLSALTGEDDVVFGEVRRCRRSSIPDAELIIGVLINTVPVRARVPGDRPLLALLRDLDHGEATLGAFEHTPLVEVVACTEVPPGAGLFDTAVVISDAADDSRLGSLLRCAEPAAPLHEQTAFAFTLRATLEPSLVLTLAYDPARFDAEWPRRIAMLLDRLLGAMARRPEATLAELPTLPVRDERALRTFNRPVLPPLASVCVHELVEAQVDRTPDAVAVRCGLESMTFRELDERANHVAHDLVARGVGPDRSVGVFVDRSLEMVVGLLGILKAGGAYVPLDSSYPPERVAMMLEDTRPGVVVTTARLGPLLPPVTAHLTVLEGFGRERRGDRPRTAVRPDHLAYVIFTSGSTGRPKGVQVEHRHVVSSFEGMDGVLGTTPGVWLALAGISFDISVLELFWTLCRGFTIVFPDRAGSAGQAAGIPGVAGFGEYRLRDQIPRHGITHLQCTPSRLEQLTIEDGGCEALGTLRHLLVGGEALPAALVDQVGPHLTGTLHNMYGPTETTIWATAAAIIPGQPITIGRPLSNTTVYIRDRAGRPVPIGVPGELFIGGAGVTRGYLGQPELTGQRFVQDPGSGERLYRTGDLAAWRPDGELLFLGRLDTQVKVRGHRVELGEIETVIGDHPSVRECVTVAQGASGDVRLVAFVVPREIADPSPESPVGSSATASSATTTGTGLAAVLRQYAQTRLPAYMVPRAVVPLNAMPLTPNGKVNRRALAALAAGEPAEHDRPPENSRERPIVAVMEELLGRQVGVDDNFFDVGAHSLLLMQASARLQARFGGPVPIVEMLRHPSARTLASALAAADAARLAFDQGHDRAARRQDALRRRQTGRRT